MKHLRSTRLAALLTVAALALSACASETANSTAANSTATNSTSTPTAAAAGQVSSPASPSAAAGTPNAPSGTPDSTAPGSTEPAAKGEVTLITHDSFNVDKQVLADFQAESGITINVLAQGDAGAMVNKLVLTKDNPLGDVAFGVDNTFASRALDEGVFAPYASPAASNGSQDFSIDSENRLSAVDYGDVCVNVDHKWFQAKGLKEPATFDDLAKPDYKDLLVVQSPATSSSGLAFLLGTVAEFGEDGWQQYWTSLKANGVKVTAGWEDAYTVDFSGSSGKGDRPLVVSYASSPPFEMAEGDTEAPTGALLDTCFRQVEYTGVLAGAKNPEAAKKVVDFLLSKEFQGQIAENMYVYPVDENTELPDSWAKFAPAAKEPAAVDPATIAEQRQVWVGQWSDILES